MSRADVLMTGVFIGFCYTLVIAVVSPTPVLIGLAVAYGPILLLNVYCWAKW